MLVQFGNIEIPMYPIDRFISARKSQGGDCFIVTLRKLQKRWNDKFLLDYWPTFAGDSISGVTMVTSTEKGSFSICAVGIIMAVVRVSGTFLNI